MSYVRTPEKGSAEKAPEGNGPVERLRAVLVANVALLFCIAVLLPFAPLATSRWFEITRESVEILSFAAAFCGLAGAAYVWTRTFPRPALLYLPAFAAILLAYAGAVWCFASSRLPALAPGSGGAAAMSMTALAVLAAVLLTHSWSLWLRVSADEQATRLGALLPDSARRFREEANGPDALEPAATKQLQTGDVLYVAPGERFPADGVLMDSAALVDESELTGAREPVAKRPGDCVLAGTRNGSAAATMRVEKVGEELVLRRVQRALRETLEREEQQPGNRAAIGWTLALAAIAALAGAATGLAIGQSGPYILCSAAAPLAAFAPAALLLPQLTRRLALGRLRRVGVLAKDGSALDSMARVDALAVGKSGVITMDAPQVDSIVNLAAYRQMELLRGAASAERTVQRPIASAITACARERGLQLLRAESLDDERARGVRAVISKHELLVGNGPHLERRGVDCEALEQDAARRRANGDTVVFLAVDGQPAGLIALRDEMKWESADAVEQLRLLGVETVLLSSDHELTCRALAERVRIRDVRAGLTWEARSSAVEQLAREGRATAVAAPQDDPMLRSETAALRIAFGVEALHAGTDAVLLAEGLPPLARFRKAALRAKARPWKFAAVFWAWHLTAAAAALALLPSMGLAACAAAAFLQTMFSTAVHLWASHYPELRPASAQNDADPVDQPLLEE